MGENARAATALTVAAHIARRTGLTPWSPRKPRASDLGDILHCCYLPFVDVFRADSFLAPIIVDANLPLKTVVVGKLLDVPPAIEKCLDLRVS